MAPETMAAEKEKNSMCKAMGALFLQHRVQCMEKEVEQKQQRCPIRRRMAAQQGSKSDASASASSKKSGGGGGVESRASTSTTTLVSTSTSPSKLIVVDASVLIYSLRSVHQWLKAGDVRVVVPSEAMRTLDLLKSGDDAINVAARKAARFLEENFSQAVGSKATLPSGLWPQCDSQRLDVEPARLLINAQSEGKEDGKGSDDEDDLARAPIWVREPLLCALWQQQTVAAQPGSSRPAFALALALPPPDTRDEGTAPRYAERADGSNVLSWAQLCGLQQDGDSATIHVTPTSTSWLDLAKRGPSCRQRCQQKRQERKDQGPGPKPITVMPSPKQQQQQQQQQPRAILQRGA